MIQGEFDEIGQLFFEIELVASNGEILPINALLDTGSTEWLAINKQDLEALEWEQDARSFLIMVNYHRFDLTPLLLLLKSAK